MYDSLWLVFPESERRGIRYDGNQYIPASFYNESIRLGFVTGIDTVRQGFKVMYAIIDR